MSATNVGWLTLHEVLEETGLPYAQLMELAHRGLIGTRRAGVTTLYDPDDVRAVARAQGTSGRPLAR